MTTQSMLCCSLTFWDEHHRAPAPILVNSHATEHLLQAPDLHLSAKQPLSIM